MLKRFALIILIACSQAVAFATHQRAAEITYKWINGLTYEVTITMYTYTPSPADDVRTTLPIFWGDNSFDDIPRIVFQDLPDNFTLNIYRMNHTFPAPGSYTISVEDPNRNFGVVNIPNSVNVPMYVESTLIINPFLGNNNSVQLLNPPVDKGCVGKLFVHNAAAFDPDGDSLSYRLVNCKGAAGLDIPGYTLPMASEQFYMDPITGDLIWENPVLQGEYNVAFIIEEWRNGIKIGSVTRDMQIEIAACDNNPPIIIAPTDTCLVAGNTLFFDVTAIDPDGNLVTLTANGGPFEVAQNPAQIVPDPASGNDTVTTTFYWNTNCSHVRRSAYTALFRARDSHPIVSLTSYKSVNITVIGPAVGNLTAEPLGNSVILNWDAYACANANGFRIYRRSGLYGFEPGYCETGVPAYTGYQLIAETNTSAMQSFTDNNDGFGLIPGIDYCYMITAIFPDGAESIASNESCAALQRDLPVMTHVSNDSLNLQSGRVLTAWSKPVDLDTMQYPGPYRYNLYRSQGVTQQNNQLIHTGFGLNDTLYTDNGVNLNESGIPYNYFVELESETVGVIGNSRPASSLFLEIFETDTEIQLSWNPDVPWVNDSILVYRQGPGENSFQFVGSSTTNVFHDQGLENEQTYCYYLQSVGGYSVPGIIHPIINFSQIACGQPIDNVPPCPPVLSVTTDCELIENRLSWYNPYDSCSYDIEKYYVYYTPTANQAFQRIDSLLEINDTIYVHRNLSAVTGCYFVKAVDDYNNISEASNIVCVGIEACPIYELPNVFTPNGDQINDFFVPINYPVANPNAIVDRVEMTIFNRWGNVVYETTDPLINWDGKHYRTGSDVSDGVYFYVCKVFITTFGGIEEMRLQGSVTIMR
jgi:gliding motility-associated-like protein